MATAYESLIDLHEPIPINQWLNYPSAHRTDLQAIDPTHGRSDRRAGNNLDTQAAAQNLGWVEFNVVKHCSAILGDKLQHRISLFTPPSATFRRAHARFTSNFSSTAHYHCATGVKNRPLFHLPRKKLHRNNGECSIQGMYVPVLVLYASLPTRFGNLPGYFYFCTSNTHRTASKPVRTQSSIPDCPAGDVTVMEFAPAASVIAVTNVTIANLIVLK